MTADPDLSLSVRPALRHFHRWIQRQLLRKLS